MVRTRGLLQLAAFAAAEAVVVGLLGPANATIALISPLLYAVAGSLEILLPITARLWSRIPGAGALCAVLAGLVVAPLSVLGFLLPLAIGLPALAFDAVLWRARQPRTLRIVLAALAGAVVIWAISLPVINAELLTTALIIGLLVVRVLVYVPMALAGRAIARRLEQAGVRPDKSVRSPQGEPTTRKS